jgi:hypothetical protein
LKIIVNKIKRDNSKKKYRSITLYVFIWKITFSYKHTCNNIKQECDVISVSKSDYIYEYEVKISRADYRKILKEKHTHIINENYTKTRKGELVYLLLF